ncbi:unnamed protein product [Moneuplotes crassus]|uniref:Methenyltetrahydrofolate cyclohydrolase n=1 Tax=Euplotes crassus TaxID=5936 RepID=A0AAD1XMT8_EUPCR|nr:unnamed protein product [Moneuplotes crassus]
MEETKEKEFGNLIRGKKVAKEVQDGLKAELEELQTKSPKVTPKPGFGYIIVGERPDSSLYVKMKIKACEEIGIQVKGDNFPVDATEEEVITKVQELNDDPEIHGILVQLPLPDHIDEDKVLSIISKEKDVDGLHPANVADLVMRGKSPRFVACTPFGCLHLIKTVCPDLSGLRAAVIGRSNIVGLPMFSLLQDANATVTLCHSRTKDIESILKECDIVVAAIGKPQFVKGEWLKPGCIVIDVGIHSIEDKTKKSGTRLVGDVDTASAKTVAKYITPVPGGVGPMTIAMLMNNIVKSWKIENFDE